MMLTMQLDEQRRQERLERLERDAAAARSAARSVVLAEVRRVESLVTTRGDRRVVDLGHQPERRRPWTR